MSKCVQRKQTDTKYLELLGKDILQCRMFAYQQIGSVTSFGITPYFGSRCIWPGQKIDTILDVTATATSNTTVNKQGMIFGDPCQIQKHSGDGSDFWPKSTKYTITEIKEFQRVCGQSDDLRVSQTFLRRGSDLFKTEANKSKPAYLHFFV